MFYQMGMGIRSDWRTCLVIFLPARCLFPVPLKTPVLFTLAELKTLLDAATDHQRLYVLLALNCGMYPSDIAKLKQSEVDWKAGRIMRKRTKTRDRSENVPRVDYLL